MDEFGGHFSLLNIPLWGILKDSMPGIGIQEMFVGIKRFKTYRHCGTVPGRNII
jgi:hypothetical protein